MAEALNKGAESMELAARVDSPVLVDRDYEICSGSCEPAVVEAYLSSQASDQQERIGLNR